LAAVWPASGAIAGAGLVGTGAGAGVDACTGAGIDAGTGTGLLAASAPDVLFCCAQDWEQQAKISNTENKKRI